jgi:hypothetical protein
VVDLVPFDGVAERAHDGLLADDTGERPRPVTAVERALRRVLWILRGQEG